jgi:ankyrin repeat protein
VCQLDTMKKCLTPAMVRAELKRMPETLDQTYDRILQSVPSLHESFVQSALHWLAFATRPLQLQELAEAAVLRPESGSFEPDVCRLLDENLILELCGTLVTASIVEYREYGSDDWLSEKLRIRGGFYSPYMNNNKFSIVSLSHYSVKEYIASQRLQKGALSTFYASEKLANTYLAECCLFYLLEFNRGEIALELDFKESPLLEYSACNWMSHWKHASRDGQSHLRHLAERFFDLLSSNAYVNWLNVWIPETILESTDKHYYYHRDIRKSAEFYPPVLYWAASLGDLALVQSLVEDGADIMKRGGKFESPLGAAAYHGHSDVVEYLLQQGANPNLPSRGFGTVLQIAALGGSVKVVKQLIDAGADINAQGGGHNTALVAAASKEHIDVVTLLVKHGADLNIGSRSHGSSLYRAAAAGDTKMVITLLGAGAGINEIGDSDGTPLYAAAESGSLPLVQLLLRRGADVNKGAPSASYGFPVTIAAKEGHSQIVRALIRAGADVNLSMGHRGVSTLEAAVEGRDMPTFLAVLDAGADLNVSGQLYLNCFHAAIWTGELAMAKILLERGAEFEDEGFLEAVHRYEQNPWFLNELLEKNPNCDAWRDNDGSALHVAIKAHNEKAAWLILDQKPFLDAVSEDGSPLGVAIEKGMVDLAKELIRRGADVNRRVKGDSPFGLAISHACKDGNGDLTLADMLLEHGADINMGTWGW